MIGYEGDNNVYDDNTIYYMVARSRIINMDVGFRIIGAI